METQKKVGELYQKIAEHLNEMIPSQWKKIILYAEILDDSADIYFILQHQTTAIIYFLIIYLNTLM